MRVASGTSSSLVQPPSGWRSRTGLLKHFSSNRRLLVSCMTGNVNELLQFQVFWDIIMCHKVKSSWGLKASASSNFLTMHDPDNKDNIILQHNGNYLPENTDQQSPYWQQQIVLSNPIHIHKSSNPYHPPMIITLRVTICHFLTTTAAHTCISKACPLCMGFLSWKANTASAPISLNLALSSLGVSL